VSNTDALAVLYTLSAIPQTYNYYVLLNVIKVVSNFTATTITGTAITGGVSCAGTCYLAYTSMTTPVALTANAVVY
jgi:hypothetical protein